MRERGEQQGGRVERRGLERGRKKIEKDVQKVLTKNLGCGIISKLSPRQHRSFKIE